MKGPDGHFRAGASFPGDGLDLDDAIHYFGHLALEQALEEVLVRAREYHLRPPTRLVNFQDVEEHPLVDVVSLVGDLLLARKQGLDPVYVDDDVASGPVHFLDDAHNEFAFLVGQRAVDVIALGLTDALHYHLFGRLCRDASEVGGGGFHSDDVAYFGLRVKLSSFFERDLGARVGYLLHHLFVSVNPRLTGLGVYLGPDVQRRAVIPLVSRNQSGFDGFQYHFRRKLPLVAELLYGQHQFVPHNSPAPKVFLKSPLYKRKVGLTHFSQDTIFEAQLIIPRVRTNGKGTYCSH